MLSNVGVDIQNQHVSIVVASYCRNKWRLDDCWQYEFSEKLINSQGIINNEILVPCLIQLKQQLSKHLSIRIALPVQFILQQPVPLPPTKLTANDEYWYIKSSLSRLFPLPETELVFDYRQIDNNLLVTAARKSVVLSWVQAFNKAGLMPDVVDIISIILRHIANINDLNKQSILLHFTDYDQFVTVFPEQILPTYSLVRNECDVLDSVLQQVKASYSKLTQQEPVQIWLSGMIPSAFLADMSLCWSPFNFFSSLSVALPAKFFNFTIACGLALRTKDVL